MLAWKSLLFHLSKPMGSTSKKPRAFYHPEHKRRKKQHNKNKDLLKQHANLQQRVTKEGETKWLQNAMRVLSGRMQRAGVKTK
jgi:hypothetical protein